jgi:prolyl oligopeptidase
VPIVSRLFRRAVPALLLAAATAAVAGGLAYPVTRVVPQTDTQFGVEVKDPYRWLENDVRQDPQVRAWVESQNAVTEAYLETLPRRAAIAARLRELWDFEKFDLPVKEGGRYFYERNDGLQNQYVLYVQESVEGAPRPLIDPNTWSKDGATALAEWSAGPDGRRVAYAVQDGGSDWRTLRVLDVDTGSPLADEVKWAKFTDIEWAKDNSGFYYSRFPEPEKGAEFQSLNLNHAIYFHRVGTPQARDRLVYATPDRPTLGHFAQVTDDGRYLFIQTAEGTDDRYEITIIDLAVPGAKPRTLIPGLRHSYELVGAIGETLYVLTDRDAPHYRVVKIDLARSSPVELQELVPNGASLLQRATLVGDRLVLQYLQDARGVVRVHGLDGRELGSVELPGLGSVDGFAGEHGDPETFYVFSSFNASPALYRYDTATGRSSIFKQPKTPFGASSYVVRQEFYASKDAPGCRCSSRTARGST